MKKTVKNRITSILLLILIVLLVSGMFDVGFDRIFMGRIREHNIEYLNHSFDRSVKGFLVLSTIKAGLAIVEGSNIKFGFSLGAQASIGFQYGDIVQSMYDYVDIAWKTSLAGGAILLLTRLLMEAVTQIDHWFLAIAIFFLFVCQVLGAFAPGLKVLTRLSRQAFSLFFVFSAIFYLILPLTMLGASFLSAKISGPLIEEATEGYQSMEDELSPEALTERVSPFSGQETEDLGLLGRLNVPDRIERLKQKYSETMSWMKETTRDMAVWTIKLFAGYLFDCIVFPLSIFFVLFVAVKGLLGYAFNIHRDRSFREDFGAIFELYFKRNKDGEEV